MGYNLGYGEVNKFKDLMVLAQLRGEEGAGMIAIPKKATIQKSQVRVRRTTWSSGHLVTTKDFDECVKGDTNILIGHARAPTKGGNDIKNVHPHACGDVILVHNGTMTYVDDSSIPAGASDSALITKCIAEKGVQEFVNTSWGAYCLIWLDLRDQTINFLRNNERPLSICSEQVTSHPNSSTRNFWWASEGWMLNVALSRYTGYAKERFVLTQLPKNEHWKFPLDVNLQLAKPEVTIVERKVFPVSNRVYAGWEAWADENQVPFERTPATNASGLNNTGSNVATTNGPFSYIAPEFRQRGTGVDANAPSKTYPESSHNPATILHMSYQKAKMAGNKRELDERVAKAIKEAADKKQSTFLSEDKLEYFATKDKKRVLDLVTAGPCVWCSEQPQIIAGHTPRIYPVRFTETRGEYVCSACIQDLDVQRMVGIAS
jgi:hypothetical protein